MPAKDAESFKETGQGCNDINLLGSVYSILKDQEFKVQKHGTVMIHVKGKFKGGGKKARVDEEADAKDLLDATLVHQARRALSEWCPHPSGHLY